MVFSAFSGALLVAGSAYAQSPSPPAPSTGTMSSPTTAMAPQSAGGMWRGSKMIGVDVYNASDEKLGDISEVLLDPSGKVVGYVVGVGGFLGMGQHDIMVTPDKLKFVNEPMRSSATANTGVADRTATGTVPGSTATSTRQTADAKWYPDHAVMSATKDQLKAMTEFKYN
jgi:hypothetical protein